MVSACVGDPCPASSATARHAASGVAKADRAEESGRSVVVQARPAAAADVIVHAAVVVAHVVGHRHGTDSLARAGVCRAGVGGGVVHSYGPDVGDGVGPGLVIVLVVALGSLLC